MTILRLRIFSYSAIVVLIIVCSVNFSLCQSSTERQFSDRKPLITLHGRKRAPTGSIESFQPQVHNIISIWCDFNEPIEWVYSTDNLDNFQARFNYVHRFPSSVSNTSNAYRADLALLYTRSPKINVVFVCQSASRDDENKRSFVEYHGNAFPEFSNTNIASDIFKETVKKLWAEPPKGDDECRATLLIKQLPNNTILYKWEPNNFASRITKMPKGKPYQAFFDFWNSYKQYYTEQKRCTNVYRATEIIGGWKKIDYLKAGLGWIDNTTTNGIVFTVEVDGHLIVQKGMFSLFRGDNYLERTFQMTQDVRIEDMIYLDDEYGPTMYTEEEYIINCWVSVFHFAIGSVITYESDPALELQVSDEKFNPHGSRLVTKTISFGSEYGNTTQELTCFAPLLKSKNWVNHTRTISVEYSSEPELIGGTPEKLITEEGKENVSIHCIFGGKPLPDITWELPTPEFNEFLNTVLDLNESSVKSEIIFPQMRSNYTGTYKCTGKNFNGNFTHTIEISYPPNVLPMAIKVSLGIAIGAAMLIFVAVILLLNRRLTFEKEIFRLQTEDLMKEFREGCSQYTKDIFDAHFSILKQPYNTEYELPLDRWSIGNRVLGSGEFGIVRKGTVQIENSEVTVAIKTTKTQPDIADFKGFLDELKIQAYIGVHDNIVSLVAAFSEDNNTRNILIAVEFCENGSILDYIRARRNSFHNMVTPSGHLNSDFNAKAIEISNSDISRKTNLSTIDLYKWSYQIANGMEYLGNKKVLHADLASRNVMLSANNEAKIGDFGLSRILQNSENYTKKTRCPLPWKWMAIESLREMKFSTHSDMWSYGVTIWELFSLCQVPWQTEKKSWNSDFIDELERGLRLSRPYGATINIYNKVMLPSWHRDINSRLRFSEAKHFFKSALEGDFKNA